MEEPNDTASCNHPTININKSDAKAIPLGHKALQHLSWLLIMAIVVVLGLAYLLSESFQSQIVETLVVLASGDQVQIREYIRSYGVWAPAVSISLMVLQVVIAPIPASFVQLSNGVVFGVLGGAALNLIGQMVGATVAFFISRSLGRTVAERLAGRVDEHGLIEHWLDRWGGRALLAVRMIPGMPSDFVSYLMGLTSMQWRTYLTYSLIGYIPQSFAYAWLGDAAIDYFWWIMLGGFVISCIIGLVVWAVRKWSKPITRPALDIESGHDSR